MGRPTYYLWKTNFPTQEEYDAVKKLYSKSGFRVVTFQDEENEKNIHDGIKAVIKNHIDEFCN